MLSRSNLAVCTMLTAILCLAFWPIGCGEKSPNTQATVKSDSVAVTTSPPAIQPFQAVVDLPRDTPQALSRKTKEIISWTPKQSEKLNFALKGVTRIVRFADLGLGDQIDVTLPRTPSRAWPVAHSLRLVLGREKTAVVTRFKIDTLPGPRVRGEGLLGLMGIHGDTIFGRDVELPRTAAGVGRFELLFLLNRLFFQLACCDLPPTIAMSSYGNVKDTLTLIFAFDPSLANYTISVMGRESGRTYPGFYYHQFRTERGVFHQNLTTFPYVCANRDSSFVDLFVGSRFRGRKSQTEPVLTVKMF